MGSVAIFRPIWIWRDVRWTPLPAKELTDDKRAKLRNTGMVMLGSAAIIADTKDMLGVLGLTIGMFVIMIWLFQSLRDRIKKSPIAA
jgi:hypothetical protein